ncbi:uncharacterized protein P174DRAFT_433221 [Aspergillus novofumigatus IBT 16806]|uniref:Uncharacterized protein n=1 Tax=Aspergillus novofumigatus (strain IBT 16806) TaxID=1392255 RepID=A0A2I1C2D5_ASPN1|nr:uncharacterized protein P174DRAFT_433221 [Aspergillus novofumigatus IBT 16806]PKX91794.1 hypothetical protein P174DRAFT_433221 [Aspergillus novofumigatus IBT 16806]
MMVDDGDGAGQQGNDEEDTLPINPDYSVLSAHHMVRPPGAIIRQYEAPEPGGESPKEATKQMGSRVHNQGAERLEATSAEAPSGELRAPSGMQTAQWQASYCSCALVPALSGETMQEKWSVAATTVDLNRKKKGVALKLNWSFRRLETSAPPRRFAASRGNFGKSSLRRGKE